MSPEQRADDRLIMLVSRWLARHIGNAELERGLAETDRNQLAPGQLEAVEELAEHLKTIAPGRRGELEMVAREALEALALRIAACAAWTAALAFSPLTAAKMIARETLEALALGQ